METNARIFVAGSRGLVGSAVVRRLERAGASRLLTATREQLDLRDQAAVSYWFRANRPDYVFLVAGPAGRDFSLVPPAGAFAFQTTHLNTPAARPARRGQGVH